MRHRAEAEPRHSPCVVGTPKQYLGMHPQCLRPSQVLHVMRGWGRAFKRSSKGASCHQTGQPKQKQRLQDNVPLPDEPKSESEVSDQARPKNAL